MDAEHTPHRPVDAVERQAHAWLVRLTSGEATAAEGEQFRRWCAADPAHRAAFAQARQQWERIRMAGQALPAQPLRSSARQRWTRRAFLGAAVATPASLAVVAALHPPLGLWPPVSAMAADFHTGTGQRQRIEPAPQVSIELDTQTSLRRRSKSRGDAFELLQGQAAVQARGSARLALYAGAGCVVADAGQAWLDVRNTDGQVRVTCLQGTVRIEHLQGRLQLQAGQQTRYDERLSGVVSEALAAEVSAWTEGMLVFRRAPLADVVAEINRYRRGKVLLGDAALAREPVSGRFRIDDPDAALEQLRQTLSLGLRRYPGRIAVIG
ncbi:MAG: Protein FecR [Stenotrophomonas maltophilia]|uniref:Protein FecR n=1 Tax=Stenotrophomonas maltophilia TaxID=40324 RepID=A0A7V8FIR4_STEMA|nr:MAG: Protein FecR [Stenotrophomonas maltophilia]